MELDLIRYYDDGETTRGLLFVDKKFFCYTLEDQYRKVKVKGDTRIPKGFYDIQFLQQVTPLTQKYRNKFDWFNFHIHLKNVPNFTGIYIHIGNSERDTAGCILVGDDPGEVMKDGWVGKSTQAYERLYKKLLEANNAGDSIDIMIEDVNLDY